MEKKILTVLKGERVFPPPVWLMRQAGRYLEEYRLLRARAGSFLNLCFNDELAYEATLQPIRRFNLDGAIIFSDILVVPYALGRSLEFKEGVGPLLEPITTKDIGKLDTQHGLRRLSAVLAALTRLRADLPTNVTLIGFCGAPWTVATYMIAGKTSLDQSPARLFAYQNASAMVDLLSQLADFSADYLIAQIAAGAEVVQIFDSWAGVLDEDCFWQFCIEPVQRIIKRVRQKYPLVPIIAFPKGAGALLSHYCDHIDADALSLDWTVPSSLAVELQHKLAIQGNLDPLRLLSGGKALQEGVENIVRELGNGRLIFNLGHGVLPQTPVEHVVKLLDCVRGSKNNG